MVDLSISSADLISYRVRLAQPSEFGTERVGRLVRLLDREGLEGWGDVSPLPGFSSESIGDVDSDWTRNRRSITTASVPGFDFSRPDVSPAMQFATPSLRFGIEQALIGLEARAAGIHIGDVVVGDSRDTVALCGLVTEPGKVGVEEAVRLKDEGYETLKLKVGRLSLAEDVQTVLDVRHLVGGDIDLRLDANRAWSFDEASEFVDGIDGTAVAFIEEPLTDPTKLPVLFDSSGIQIGLDETLRDITPEELDRWPFATHIVLKPTLLGGIGVAAMFVGAAKRLGIAPVVSSCYESGVGIAMLACLSARWCPDGPAAGLDTYRRLESDVLSKRLQMGPVISLTGLSFEPDKDRVELG